MLGNDSELLNAVYKEINEKLGVDIAMSIYQMFKGQQINFPVRFLILLRYRRSLCENMMGQMFEHWRSSIIIRRKR